MNIFIHQKQEEAEAALQRAANQIHLFPSAQLDSKRRQM